MALVRIDGRRLLPRGARQTAWKVVKPSTRFVSTVKAVHTDTPVVALTFDDGPDPDVTPHVLHVLGRHDARATFFMLVEAAERRPDLVRDVVAGGHEIGFHGVDHTRVTELSVIDVYRRCREGRARLSAAAGVPVRLWRPPHGAQSLASFVAARLAGLRCVTWSAEGEDWLDTSIGAVVERLDAATRRGGIAVLHDGLIVGEGDAVRPNYARHEMVDAVLAALGDRQLRSITVSELLATGRPEWTVWFRR
jgi:peptidoglycan/xylan/chitin deacetylase (PgdA/CDA1 family)